MTFRIVGEARGPDGEYLGVAWEGLTADEAHRVAARARTERSLYEAFPRIFGCDPSHVEVHIEQEKEVPA